MGPGLTVGDARRSVYLTDMLVSQEYRLGLEPGRFCRPHIDISRLPPPMPCSV
jgi:hypothetical protein